MTIEAILSDILVELRGIRADINRPLRPELLAVIPQIPAPPVQPVTSAPSTVVVPPPPTVPVAPTVTSPEPTAAFAPPAPTAVPAAVPAAPPTVALAEVDSKGLPWDGRIHASSKAKVADGSWRAKRGVDPAMVTTVETELKGAAAAPVFAGQPWPFDAAPATPVGITFAGLMTVLPGKVSAGEITQQQVNDVLAALGLTSIPALATRPDLVPAVAASLGITV